MIAIPFLVNESEYSVYVGFDDDGLASLQRYDPGELVTRNLGEQWTSLKLKDVIIGYCNGADYRHAQQFMVEDGNPKRALQYLTRGWQYRHDTLDERALMIIPPDPDATVN